MKYWHKSIPGLFLIVLAPGVSIAFLGFSYSAPQHSWLQRYQEKEVDIDYKSPAGYVVVVRMPRYSRWLFSCSLYMPCLRVHALTTRYSQECAWPLARKMHHYRKSDHVTSMFKSLWGSLAYKRRWQLTSGVYKALYNPLLMEKFRLTCSYWHKSSNCSWQHILFLQSESLLRFFYVSFAYVLTFTKIPFLIHHKLVELL